MKQKLLCLFLFMILTEIYSQSKRWNDISNEKHPKIPLEFRKNMPSDYKIYSLNLEAFKNTVFSVSRGENKIIEIPTEKGIQKFSLQEASNFSSELSDKFPMIRSYIGKGIDDISASIRFSIGTDGLHVVVYAVGKPTFYIDPYTKDKQEYIAYSREKLPKQVSSFECEVKERKSTDTNENLVQRNADDGLLRTYRLAIVCSGGYAQYHLTDQGIASSATDAVKKAAVLSAMNTSMTRINGVYERDLGVRMEIVANNDEIIFLDASTDNITDGNAATMVNEVQAICDATIGDANYDIGHIFSIGGSGLAGLGVVCVTGQKGRGVTGIANPKGDPYDIDYVAHEIGHQFGANHTQNNPCSSNSSTAVEPGSASTIMGYAGICAPNVQNSSDDYFHSVNIDEMWAVIQSSASCATTTTTGNTAPTADAGLDYTVPKSTPLLLKGIGSDVDSGNVLTYNWEQIDNETVTMPPVSTNTVGPLFRSNPSTTSPNRYLPKLATVVAGNTSSTWEVIPSIGREMNFSFLVRDNNTGGANSAKDNVKITVDGTAGPFKVTSQAINSTWLLGSTQSITWDVAGTDTGAINIATVNILLSIDGGVTFPIVLATAVANDGLEAINVPGNLGYTTTARILVEANNNIFYAVNSTNFTIARDVIIEPDNISVTTTSESCVDLDDGIIAINVQQFVNYTVNITGGVSPLSGELSGSNISFTNLAPGTYKVCVSANDLDYTQCFEVTIGEANAVLLRASKKSTQSRSYAFDVETGTAPFDVFLNNKLLYRSNNRSFDLEIQNSGVLEVKTAKDCEGTFTSVINDVFLKQNPVSDFIELNLPMGIKESKIDVTIFDVTGKLIFKQSVTKENNSLRIPFDNYNFGVYILHFGIDNVAPIKILKK